jgi:hypothetical protein
MPLETIPKLTVNGIDAVTGQYAIPPLSAAELSARLRQARDTAGVSSYQTDRGRRLKVRAFPALPLGVRPEDITKAGWGILFHRDEDLGVKTALDRLVTHRRGQVGDESRVHVLTYYPEDTVESWLSNLGVGWGDIKPERVPYYLLMVGVPSRIPYQFGQVIDAEYCVGMLDLPDAASYEQYVKSVIDYETGASVPNRREVVYFGTRHPFDEATTLSADWLVTPLADGMPARPPSPAQPAVAAEWSFGQRKLMAADATRQALLDVLTASNGSQPAILFSATHGMVWPSGDEHQTAAQGALLCQDWGGLGGIAANHYVTADDVPATAKLHGLVAFLFACFGAGTPTEDRFAHVPGVAPPAIAPKAFASALPNRLLTHSGGGAIACIGHVERAWGYSIVGQTSEPQIGPFRRALGRLMLGQPVGLAVQEFNDKCATASVALANLLEKAYAGRPVDDVQLTMTWAERNDAEGYVLIGDPAVRVRIEQLPTR